MKKRIMFYLWMSGIWVLVFFTVLAACFSSPEPALADLFGR